MSSPEMMTMPWGRGFLAPPNISSWEDLSPIHDIRVALGCVFVSPIRGYADTRKKLRSFFLFAIILSRIRFVEFCQTGVLVARIPGYTLQNDHFLSVYSFIRIRRTNSPSTWKGYSFVFGTCANTRTPKSRCFPIQNSPTAHPHSYIATPIPTSHCFSSVGHCGFCPTPPPPCLPLPCCCTLQCGGGGSVTA